MSALVPAEPPARRKYSPPKEYEKPLNIEGHLSNSMREKFFQYFLNENQSWSYIRLLCTTDPPETNERELRPPM